MGLGLSSSTASAFFLAILQGTSFSYSQVWAQEHTGEPGAAGTSNVTSGSTRVDVSACFGTAPDAGTPGTVTIANDAEMGPFHSDSSTHLSLWSASSSGTFICSGEATFGSDVTIAIGDCTLSFPVAS